jgi:hypothetical protein
MERVEGIPRSMLEDLAKGVKALSDFVAAGGT